MFGIVEYFLERSVTVRGANRNHEGGFGFIRFRLSDNSDRLDGSIYFSDVTLRSPVERGSRVSFDVEMNEDKGQEEATNISLVNDRLTGVVVKRGSKPFCIVAIDGRNDRGVVCSYDDVIPDSIGRRVLPFNARVSFRLSRKGKWTFKDEHAVDVLNEDSELNPIDASTYLEFGRVEHWDGNTGHVRRPNGDTLCFILKNVISEGSEEIQIGKHLQYGVTTHRFLFDRKSLSFRHRVYARDISVTVGESAPLVAPGSIEAHFLAAPELPLGPERPEPGRIYTARECRTSLREIIEARRAQQKVA